MEQDTVLKQGIKRGDKQLFSSLFQMYYKDLVLYAGRYIPRQTTCEDIVQTVFTKLWSDRGVIEIDGTLRTYMLRSVINLCIDEIRHNRTIEQYQEYFLNIKEEASIEQTFLYSELSEHLNKALEQLPGGLRQVFVMSRMKGMKYGEIAEKLNVSVRTVEVRMSQALSKIRISLKEFISLIIAWFLFNNL